MDHGSNNASYEQLGYDNLEYVEISSTYSWWLEE